MESTQDPEATPPSPPPRRFVSSIPLSEPSRRSVVLLWLFVGVAVTAVGLVVWLYYTSGFSLWFSR
jgi:hypothetical protein